MTGHHVDITAHAKDNHALWEEVCRLRALLREVLAVHYKHNLDYHEWMKAKDNLEAKIEKELGE